MPPGVRRRWREGRVFSLGIRAGDVLWNRAVASVTSTQSPRTPTVGNFLEPRFCSSGLPLGSSRLLDTTNDSPRKVPTVCGCTTVSRLCTSEKGYTLYFTTVWLMFTRNEDQINVMCIYSEAGPNHK